MASIHFECWGCGICADGPGLPQGWVQGRATPQGNLLVVCNNCTVSVPLKAVHGAGAMDTRTTTDVGQRALPAMQAGAMDTSTTTGAGQQAMTALQAGRQQHPVHVGVRAHDAIADSNAAVVQSVTPHIPIRSYFTSQHKLHASAPSAALPGPMPSHLAAHQQQLGIATKASHPGVQDAQSMLPTATPVWPPASGRPQCPLPGLVGAHDVPAGPSSAVAQPLAPHQAAIPPFPAHHKTLASAPTRQTPSSHHRATQQQQLDPARPARHSNFQDVQPTFTAPCPPADPSGEQHEGPVPSRRYQHKQQRTGMRAASAAAANLRPGFVDRALHGSSRTTTLVDRIRPVATPEEEKLFLQLYPAFLSGCRVDWKGMAVAWNQYVFSLWAEEGILADKILPKNAGLLKLHEANLKEAQAVHDSRRACAAAASCMQGAQAHEDRGLPLQRGQASTSQHATSIVPSHAVMQLPMPLGLGCVVGTALVPVIPAIMTQRLKGSGRGGKGSKHQCFRCAAIVGMWVWRGGHHCCWCFLNHVGRQPNMHGARQCEGLGPRRCRCWLCKQH